MAVPSPCAWYAKLAGSVSGPFTIEELQFLVSRGRLLTSDLVTAQGEEDWAPAGDMEVLFPGRSEPAPPDPPGRQSGVSERANATPRPMSTQPVPPELPVPASGPFPTLVPRKPPPAAGANSRRKAVIIGTSIGLAMALLLLLLLLLLRLPQASSPNGWSGSGGGLGGGTGAGVGTGSGDGEGEGVQEPMPEEGADGAATGEPDATTVETRQEPQPRPDIVGPKPPSAPRQSLLAIRQMDSPETRPGDFLGDRASGRGGAAGGGGGRGGDGSEFFGVKARGRSFVYVVDCSGSMTGDKFMKACDEMMGSVERLNSLQSFYVIFFDNHSYPMFHPDPPEPKMLKATRQNVGRLQQWVNGFSGGGGTDPTDAMTRALALKPDGVFLLTDGEFPPRAVEVIRMTNLRRTIINTIGFRDRSGEPLLRQIALENRGEYRFVP